MLSKKRRLLLSILIAAIIVVIGQFALRYYYHPTRNNPPDGVVILTTQWCPYCQALRKQLQAWDVPYREYDVESGWANFWRHRASGEWGIPVTYVGKEKIYGYDLVGIATALNKVGHEVNLEAIPATPALNPG
ncbi:MAG: glutaredoxin domain-containing protein [Salinisphaeraceae bacterium]|nr:glutaredoxin domain-containing protein [Salinisphaeraceae bacterium]